MPTPKRQKLTDALAGALTPGTLDAVSAGLRKVQNGGVTPEVDRRAQLAVQPAAQPAAEPEPAEERPLAEPAPH